MCKHHSVKLDQPHSTALESIFVYATFHADLIKAGERHVLACGGT